MLRSRLLVHAPAFVVLWLALTRLNYVIDPLWSYYLAMTAMYATAMMGMVVLVGLTGQVSLGNGALMAVGGYAFAVSSMKLHTVPILGLPWNAVWSMVVAGLAGVAVGGVVGALGARLKGPYLAGLTLGLAVGIPAIASRFPSLLGGSQGLLLTVPYPEGGYPEDAGGEVGLTAGDDEAAALDEALGLAPESDVAADPETLGADDLLTVDDVAGGVAADDLLTVDDVAGGVAADDLLTVDDVAGGVAADDLLTVDDVAGGVAADDLPLPDVPAVDVPVDAVPVEAPLDAGFVLEQWQATLAITLACIAGFIALNLVRGRQGRVWRAVRDDSVAAAVIGIHPARAKVSAFVLSSLFAALAGAVFVQILAYAGPGAFSVGLSLSLLVGVVLGGRDSLLGAVLGAALLVGLPVVISEAASGRGWPDQVSANAPSLLYGLLVVLVVLVLPGGVVSLVRRRSRGAARP